MRFLRSHLPKYLSLFVLLVLTISLANEFGPLPDIFDWETGLSPEHISYVHLHHYLFLGFVSSLPTFLVGKMMRVATVASITICGLGPFVLKSVNHSRQLGELTLVMPDLIRLGAYLVGLLAALGVMYLIGVARNYLLDP